MHVNARARKNKKSEEMATVPEAPPSTLSKKFIELVIPTIHRVVIATSIIVFPVGLPRVLVAIKITAITRPNRF